MNPRRRLLFRNRAKARALEAIEQSATDVSTSEIEVATTDTTDVDIATPTPEVVESLDKAPKAATKRKTRKSTSTPKKSKIN